MRGETVYVLTTGTITDPYSGEVVDDTTWAAPSRRAVQTLAPAEPRPSDEPVQDARNSVTEGWTLYLPAGDPVSSRNRVEVRGRVFPVRGTPSDWLGRGVVVQAYGVTG